MKSEYSFLIFPGRLSGWIRYAACATAVIIAAHLAHPLLAQQSAAPAFSSPANAVDNLFKAVQSNDTAAIQKVLGGPTDLAACGDGDQDKLDRGLFVKKYQEMHRLHREADGSVTLYIGAENWPFPIPLVEQGGAWHFDPEAGGKEVLFRRIGENELEAIEICHGLVAAQDRSNSGAGDTNASPFVSALSEATDKSAPVLLNGYFFRVLAAPSRKGGAGRSGKPAADVAVVAYPAEYRQSGVMTFVMTGNDAIYEKDLGVNTSALASTLTRFRMDGTWRPVTE
jgi:hypothetical protein